NSPFFINHHLQPWLSNSERTRRAGVSAFGFGGSNFHAVLEEHDALKSEPAWDGSVQIAAFSGEDRTQVARQLEAFSQAAADASTAVDLALAAAHSRNVFRVDHAWRLALVLTPADDLPAARRQCERAAECLAGETAAVTTDPPIFIGHGTPAGGLAFLFPGQGSQYVGMGRDLICCFPGSLAAFEAAAHHFDAPLPLSDYLYPRMRGDSADHDVRLRATDIAQPAIGAVSTAMLEALTYFGVVPNAVCGHSFGELTALHAAGCISREALWQLSQIRGRLMAATGANGRDPGAMLAVQAPLEELAAVLESRCPEVVLANRNSPRQAVLSGPTDAIGAAEVVCREKSWNSMRLPVAAAFHSPLVADAREPLVQALAQIDWQPGTLPVLSNTTGTAYPSDPAAAMALWAGQLARPVDFVANLKQLYTDGIRTFVEVGPKAVLSRFVHDTLGPTNSAALAVDRSAGRRAGIADLACLLAELVALGHRVHLERWETPVFQPRMPRMRIPLSGANYRSSRLPKTALTDQVPLRTADVSTASRQAAAIVPPTAQPSESLPLSPAAAMTTGIKPPGPTGQGKNSDMNTPKPPSQVDHALAAVQQGLSAFQALQTQTTQAHQKYLDTQAEAHRTLRQMLQSTQQMTSVLLGQDPPAPAPTAQSSTDPESYKAMAPLPSATPFSDSIPKIQTETRETPPMPPAIASSEPQTPDAASSETVRQTLLTVVSQLTGYPEEMLGLQMDIEADLGIDSIKRVEILSALEERMPHLPKVTPDLVGTLTTLGHICDFLSQGRAPSPTPAHTTAPETPVVESSPGNGMGRFVIRLTTPIALSDTALPFTPAPDHFIGVVS
ncbi:MAG: acyltransferase domain-containing protein, partial [Desulfatitalea sp.]|nr:acyltransferase domain-containing protein [Desulfatitalea sp.]NNJ99667.1 acyltransferase domain-containing protein [Desulfatitalea sp.]